MYDKTLSLKIVVTFDETQQCVTFYKQSKSIKLTSLEKSLSHKADSNTTITKRALNENIIVLFLIFEFPYACSAG